MSSVEQRARELLARFGVEDAREGRRAVGHSGPENDEWEDYIEVPTATLAKIAAALRQQEQLAEHLREQPEARGVVDEADELLRGMGLDPARFRTEGGSLNAGKVRAAILHPEEYDGHYLTAQQQSGAWGVVNSALLPKHEATLRQYVSHLRSKSPTQSTRPRWADIAQAIETMLAALTAAQQPAPPSAPVGVEASNPLLAVARRNIRQFLAKASFASEVDRWSAGQCIDVLEANITQQPAQAVSRWKLVPVKATEAMQEAFNDWRPTEGNKYAGAQSVSAQDRWEFRQRYAAMLAAAPTPPGDDAAGGSK